MLLWQDAIVNLINENSFIYSDRNVITFIINVNDRPINTSYFLIFSNITMFHMLYTSNNIAKLYF